jgi:hypothetical protein
MGRDEMSREEEEDRVRNPASSKVAKRVKKEKQKAKMQLSFVVK